MFGKEVKGREVCGGEEEEESCQEEWVVGGEVEGCQKEEEEEVEGCEEERGL